MAEYTATDRYRDFREVFYGTEAGRRVLNQVMALCAGHEIGANQIQDHAYLAYRVGQNSVGLQIQKWLEMEPTDLMVEREEEGEE